MKHIKTSKKDLLLLIADLVVQNCRTYPEDPSALDSGFIRCHSDALKLLVGIGAMVCIADGSPGRGYIARFVTERNWESVLQALEK